MKYLLLVLMTFFCMSAFAAKPVFQSGDIVDLKHFSVEFKKHQSPGPLGLIIKGKATMYVKHKGKIIAKYRYEFDHPDDLYLFKYAMSTWSSARHSPGMTRYARIKIPDAQATTGYGEFQILGAEDPATINPSDIDYFVYQKFHEDVSLAEIIESTLPREDVIYRGIPVGFNMDSVDQPEPESDEYIDDYMDADLGAEDI